MSGKPPDIDLPPPPIPPPQESPSPRKKGKTEPDVLTLIKKKSFVFIAIVADWKKKKRNVGKFPQLFTFQPVL